MSGMVQERRRGLVWVALSAPVRWARDRYWPWRRRPPKAGVCEPRRPKPTLPGAAVALAEPRAHVRRRIKLLNRRGMNTR